MIFHHDGSEPRALGHNVNYSGPKFAAIPFAEFLESSGIGAAPDPRELGAFDRYQTNVPILNQGQVGSCDPHAHTSAIMKTRDLAGMTFAALSGPGLYAYVNRGVDQGSDSDAVCQAIHDTGIPLLSDCAEGGFYRLNQLSQAARAAALRFRMPDGSWFNCENFAEGYFAEFLGFATTWTVRVGSNFNPGADGVAGFSPGVANHCTSGGEAGYILPDGTPVLQERNSWDTTWGGRGKMRPGCYGITARHTDNQPYLEIRAIRHSSSDPLDPNLPPITA